MRILIHSPDDAAAWSGERERWRTAAARCAAMLVRRPALRSKLPRYFDVLADSPNVEIERVAKVLDWLDTRTAAEHYPRQLPISGIDSKWLESRAAMISGLRGAPLEFRRPPFTARIRLLDPALSRSVGGLTDICAPVDELAALNIRPSRVWIVENLQTGLAFGPLPGSVVFMGLGYGVPVIASIPWVLSAPECCYWGDIDTHGFAILSRARLGLPQLRSILMDETTLLQHRELWVEEPAPCQPGDAPALTPQEQALFISLLRNRLGARVRLEQERIAWDYAWNALLNCGA